MATATSWLDRTPEAVLEPELPICDPHHHLWEFPTSVYLVEELLQDLGAGHNVAKTVSRQCLPFLQYSGGDCLGFPLARKQGFVIDTNTLEIFD